MSCLFFDTYLVHVGQRLCTYWSWRVALDVLYVVHQYIIVVIELFLINYMLGAPPAGHVYVAICFSNTKRPVSSHRKLL